MARVLERLDFLSSPKDAPPAEPADKVPLPAMPAVPSAEQSLAFLVHGIDTWGRTVIDSSIRPVTSGPLTEDRVRALDRAVDDLKETVAARSRKGKAAKVWEEMSEALKPVNFIGFSYRQHLDILMFANCLYFERARRIWTDRIAKLPSS